MQSEFVGLPGRIGVESHDLGAVPGLVEGFADAGRLGWRYCVEPSLKFSVVLAGEHVLDLTTGVVLQESQHHRVPTGEWRILRCGFEGDVAPLAGL